VHSQWCNQNTLPLCCSLFEADPLLVGVNIFVIFADILLTVSKEYLRPDPLLSFFFLVGDREVVGDVGVWDSAVGIVVVSKLGNSSNSESS